MCICCSTIAAGGGIDILPLEPAGGGMAGADEGGPDIGGATDVCPGMGAVEVWGGGGAAQPTPVRKRNASASSAAFREKVLYIVGSSMTCSSTMSTSATGRS